MMFAEKLAAARDTSGDIALLLKPRLLQIPLPMQRFDDPFLPFGKAIISATRDLVCAYVFDLAAYLALGGAGAVALERTLAYVGAETIKILHGPFATPDFAAAASDNAFAVDAVTLVDEAHLPAYTEQPSRGAYVLRAGTQPVIVPFPANTGVYWHEIGLFSLIDGAGRNLQIRLAGEHVLYAGRGDDFTERVRAALLEVRS